VKTAFTQRRKQLRKVLRSLWPDDALALAWKTLGLADDIRPEALDATEFAALARRLGPCPGARPG
jgi:16S rRNA A1518/A1519 N6-dimethyltransferase RsmA/KsgA/DIM1 with predicted DNA glycosylase/AP lyase activity